MSTKHFDEAAATWDSEPLRIALMKAVGECILGEARPSADMEVLDYGCGTGLVSLYLLPHVRSVTGADSSPGMLEVLERKLAAGAIANMRVLRLDLEHDAVPARRYDMIVSSMTLHHVADTECVLTAFHRMIRPGGTLCIADLDTEPGTFHPDAAAAGVHHHGFDRVELRRRLEGIGFTHLRDRTAHTIVKPVADGVTQAFPVFLITAAG
jgi:ubiquinone/menaquinone biosynthesis C-methylase UbiE